MLEQVINVGEHKKNKVPIGAYVTKTLCDYIDRLIEERGLESKSDSLRLIIQEHMTLAGRAGTDTQALTSALTPAKDDVNGNHQELLQTPSNADYEDESEAEDEVDAEIRRIAEAIERFQQRYPDATFFAEFSIADEDAFMFCHGRKKDILSSVESFYDDVEREPNNSVNWQD